MNPLITLDNVSLAYGIEPLLDHVKLQIIPGERVCLIGRNGAGKSSLLKVIEGTVLPDSGTVWRTPKLRMARLAQELPSQRDLTVFEFAAQGLAQIGQLLASYHQLTHRLAEDHSEKALLALERIQQEIDAHSAWQYEQTINQVLVRLELDPEQRIADLSGGWQRRAALAQALVTSPELLLLDEPTNHLDIEAIQWLEDQLLNSGVGLLFITHDRALLQRLATRIIELDRGNLTSWPGDYANFLRRKEEMLHAEAKQNADFDKKLMQEERWIRQGIKARRTRNEGRVRALESMRMQRSKRREQQGKATFNMNEGEQSGQIVIAASHITHAFKDKPVINDFSIDLMRGDKIGLVGPNGVGKTTLINILLGKLTPQAGEVKHGTKLQIAYSDQLREALNPDKTVIDNVAEGRQSIEVDGQQKHIISYLGDFLFTPQRAMTPVKALSGGECNRLLLARLFSQPANFFVLDEPTNDLDIETLELLEELLMQFQGTLLVVSHDRIFLDNVVTSTLIFEGEGQIEEYVGGYHDGMRQSEARAKARAVVKKEEAAKPKEEVARSNKKLSYKEQRELEELPLRIEELEAKQQSLQTQTADAAFYKKPADEVQETMKALTLLAEEIEAAYARWELLNTKARG